MTKPLPVKELLPLLDHAELLIVHDDHFDVQTQSRKRRKLLYCHLNTAVPDKKDNRAIRRRDRSPDCGGKPEAHRSEPA